MEKIIELENLVKSFRDDYEKFIEKGNKTAGTRARKTLQDIRNVANLLKHSWNIINGLRAEVPTKYEISIWDRFLLGLSISYIITALLTGIQL